MKCGVNKCFVYELLVLMLLWLNVLLNIEYLTTFLDPKNMKKLYHNYPLKDLIRAIPHQLSPKSKKINGNNNVNDLVKKIFLGKKNTKKITLKQDSRVDWHLEIISEGILIIIEGSNPLEKLRRKLNTISLMITIYLKVRIATIKFYAILRQPDI